MQPRRGFVGVMHICLGLDGYRSFRGADWANGAHCTFDRLGYRNTHCKWAGRGGTHGGRVQTARSKQPDAKGDAIRGVDGGGLLVRGSFPLGWVLTNGGAGKLCWLRMGLTSWKRWGRC